MPDSAATPTQDAELRAHVERTLSNAYEVDQELGRGGMGIVYRARDKRLKRTVAIKILPPELGFRRDIRSRFLREAETAAQLSHPNIVPIYSVDEMGNLVFFVMACVDGDNLARQVQKRGPLPIADVRRWLTEVADALAYAHHRGVVHRDIKPDNILIDDVDGRAMVTDFGIARALTDDGSDASRLTATGMAIGTPTYMSPEQASGDREIDGRTDLYALGVVAYQMLVGEPPFIGNTTPALLIKHLTETPTPPEVRRADVPPDLAAIVMRLLEKNPDARIQTAAELAQALRTGVLPAAPHVETAQTPVRFDGRPIGGMSMQTPSRSTAPDVSVALPGEEYQPTALDIQRWDAPIVASFRKQLATYLFINGALVVVSLFTRGDMLGVTTVWTIFIAYKYAKLWSEGYDWKDVLRQPRDRMFGDVVSDIIDSFVSVFSSSKREELRAKGHRSTLRGALSSRPSIAARSGAPAGTPTGGLGTPGSGAPMRPVRVDELGPYAQTVQRAREDREEIARLLQTMPADERKRMPDVASTANALVAKMEAISASLARTERELQLRPIAEIDAEVATLEAQANPLDIDGSEARVRRLAQLRRERRAAVDGARQLDERRAQLESCRLALENVRIDLVRLRTGASSVQSVTLIAEKAMALAHEVDIAVAAAQEIRDATRVKTRA